MANGTKVLHPALVRARGRLAAAEREIAHAQDLITIGRSPNEVINRIQAAEHELHMARSEARNGQV